MKTKDLTGVVISVMLFATMLILSFWIGRIVGRAEANDGLVEKTDTVFTTDTILDPNPKMVHDTLWKTKRVPFVVGSDTIVKTDTIIKANDSVAVIPISLRTYTDSLTYKAVVSGYDPRLEEIQVFQTNTVITRNIHEPRFSIGLQGGLYVTPKGLQPAIGVGVNYRLGNNK